MSEPVKSLSEMYSESGGKLTDGLLEEVWARFAPDHSAPDAKPEPSPVPVRPLAEVMKESRGGHDTDLIVDQLAARQLAEDGMTLVDPVAVQAAAEAAEVDRERTAFEWYKATEIADPEAFGAAKEQIIQFVQANYPEQEAAEIIKKADGFPTAFKNLYKRLKEAELAEMVAHGKAHYPDAYRSFMSSEERELEAAQVAEQERVEKLLRRKERLKQEMRSSDSRVSQRAEAAYISEFVKT